MTMLYCRVFFIAAIGCERPKSRFQTIREIANVLQCAPRHGERGVMKVHWDLADYHEMASKPLPFTDDDARPIDLGLSLRMSISTR